MTKIVVSDLLCDAVGSSMSRARSDSMMGPQKTQVSAQAHPVFFHDGLQIVQFTPHDFDVPLGRGDRCCAPLPRSQRSRCSDLTAQFVAQLLPTVRHLNSYDHRLASLLQRVQLVRSPEKVNCSAPAAALLTAVTVHRRPSSPIPRRPPDES